MGIVLVVVGLVVVAAVVALVVINPKMEQRRVASVDSTRAALGGAAAIATDDGASCYGVEVADGKPRHYGQGAAALSADAFAFTAVVSGDTVVVPRTAITSVEVETSHIIKSATTLVLKIVWDDPTEGECSGRWKLADLETWVTALGGTMATADDAEG